jgi:hypothetical protein
VLTGEIGWHFIITGNVMELNVKVNDVRSNHGPGFASVALISVFKFALVERNLTPDMSSDHGHGQLDDILVYQGGG